MVENAIDFFDMIGQTDWGKSLYRTLVHWIGIHIHDEVLDVGCGAGHFLAQLAQRANRVVGVDVDPAMVSRAELNLGDYRADNAQVVVGAIQALPFADASFDVVTCINVLFMFEHPIPLVQELYRVCRPGGQVILVDPAERLNPWTAQTYCLEHRSEDFERDSFLSFATAAARYRRSHEVDFGPALDAWGIERIETSHVLDGLLDLVRMVKPGEKPVRVASFPWVGTDAAAELAPGMRPDDSASQAAEGDVRDKLR